MELAYTKEEGSFREEVHSFIRDNLPADIQDKVLNGKKMEREDYLRWHTAGLAPVRIAVNVSPLQLRHRGRVRARLQRLVRLGIDGRR